MEKAAVSKATLGRLPDYLRVLKELPPNETPYISATAIARMLDLGEVQVRKDLAAVSGAGRPKLGYATAELIDKIEQCLGLGQLTSAVLVGTGRLGRALMQDDEFERYGVKIAAAFDLNDRKIMLGSEVEVLPMNQFESFCRAHRIHLGIVTVGKGSAQTVCDQMVRSGITAIWNFAPCRLAVPKSVLLQNENLALSLAHLNNQSFNFN